MAKYKMTDRWVSSFAPEGSGRAEVGDLLCPGLYLRSSAGGAKSWSAVIRVGEQVQRVTIGRYPVVTLAGAREETLRLLRMAQDGAELRERSRAARAAAARSSSMPQPTLGEVIDAYVAHMSRGARSWEMVANSLRRPEMQPLLGCVATQVTKRDLVEVVDGIAAAGHPHAATNLLRHAKMMLNFAVERDLLPANPLDKVRAPAKTTERDRVLTDDELGRVWRGAGDLPQPWRAMIRMLMLTGQRRSEVSNASWGEVNLHDGNWLIPRERVKKDRPHAVPLVRTAVALLAELPRPASGTGFVFSNDGGLTAASNFHKTKLKIDAASGVSGWVLHDLRRTVRSGLAALGVPEVVARAVVNHADGKVDRIYNRHTYAAEKREALEAWEHHLTKVSRSPDPAVTSDL